MTKPQLNNLIGKQQYLLGEEKNQENNIQYFSNYLKYHYYEYRVIDISTHLMSLISFYTPRKH